MRRVASMPSTPGMRTSITTTSGTSSVGQGDGLCAVARLRRRPRCPLAPGGSRGSRRGRALRRRREDADHRVRQREPRLDEVAAVAAAGVELSAVDADAFAHAGDAAPAADRRRRGARRARVGDAQFEVLRAVADAHGRGGRAGVLERVRERLLDDPVRAQLQPGREVAAVALDHELDGKSGAADVAEQRGEVAEPRLRRERGLVGDVRLGARRRGDASRVSASRLMRSTASIAARAASGSRSTEPGRRPPGSPSR